MRALIVVDLVIRFFKSDVGEDKHNIKDQKKMFYTVCTLFHGHDTSPV